MDRFRTIAESLAATGREIYARGWAPGTSGNYCAVVERDPLRLAITASGLDKGRLAAEGIVQIGEDCRSMAGQIRPSAEAVLHVAVVKATSDSVVLHTHSIFGTILSEAHANDGGIELEGFEVLAGLDRVETHEQVEHLPIIDNTRDWASRAVSVEEMLRARPELHGFLIRKHGLYTWGADLDAARRHLEILEFLLEVVARTKE